MPPFGSPNTNAWPISSFDSNNTIINDVPVQRYSDFRGWDVPNKSPTRTFSVRTRSHNHSRENLEEDVTHSADINLLEFRWAGRTWVPLWGMGRFGFSLGAIGNAINYKINGTRTITSLGPAFPGTVVFSETGNVDAWIANYGGFVGTDVELGSRNIFVKASGECQFYCTEVHVSANVNRNRIRSYGLLRGSLRRIPFLRLGKSREHMHPRFLQDAGPVQGIFTRRQKSVLLGGSNAPTASKLPHRGSFISHVHSVSTSLKRT